MIHVQGNIWDFHKAGHWIAIPTNGSVRNDGKAVMGRGLAQEAAQKFPGLARLLGLRLQRGSNIPYLFSQYKIVTIPVKHKWRDNADLDLILQSCRNLKHLTAINFYPLYIPHLGCGFGRLSWVDVKPALEQALSDDFIVVSRSVNA